RVGGLVESNVRIANLYKGEILAVRILLIRRDQPGGWDSSRESPDRSGPRPLHALQKPAPVHAIATLFILLSIVLVHCLRPSWGWPRREGPLFPAQFRGG